MPTVEKVVAPLPAGVRIGDPADPVAVTLKEVLTTVLQQDGCQQARFGTQIENPQNLELLITWDSLQHHLDFIAKPEYAAFAKKFGSIFTGPGQMVHVDFLPEGASDKVFGAPMTEVAMAYYDGAVPAEYVDVVLAFGKRIAREGVEGCLGMVVGITHEDVQMEEVKGKAALVCLGWQSIEAHTKFWGTPVFQESIEGLRGQSRKVEMHHTAFMPFLG